MEPDETVTVRIDSSSDFKLSDNEGAADAKPLVETPPLRDPRVCNACYQRGYQEGASKALNACTLGLLVALLAWMMVEHYR